METSWITRHFEEALKQQRAEEEAKADARAVAAEKRESSCTLFGQLADAVASDVDEWNKNHSSHPFLVRRTRDLCEVSTRGELKAELRLHITKESDIYWISPERPLSRYVRRKEKDGVIWVSPAPTSDLFWNDLPIPRQVTPEEASALLLGHITARE